MPVRANVIRQISRRVLPANARSFCQAASLWRMLSGVGASPVRARRISDFIGEKVLDTEEHVRSEQLSARPPSCVECLEAVASPVSARGGEPLCASCAASYYVACAVCRGLIPQDEALSRNDDVLCGDCVALASSAGGVPDEAEVESLVAEFIALHAEEKRVKDRLEEIKERLKAAATTRERVAGAVTLRAEEGAVKCSFKTNLKCDAEKVSALEQLLEPDSFAALFERKVSYSPVKDQLEKFLSIDAGAGDADLRALILAAVERTETPTLTVVRPKK